MSTGQQPAAGPLRGDDRQSDGAEVQAPVGLQVRFCGGCNPFIDRVAVADGVRAGLSGTAADTMRAGLSGTAADGGLSGGAAADGGAHPAGGGASASGADESVTVVHAPDRPRTLYVSGCPRACASDHRLRIQEDAAAVVVAGEHVDAVPTVAARIAATVLNRLSSPAAPPHADRRPAGDHHNYVAHKR